MAHFLNSFKLITIIFERCHLDEPELYSMCTNFIKTTLAKSMKSRLFSSFPATHQDAVFIVHNTLGNGNDMGMTRQVCGSFTKQHRCKISKKRSASGPCTSFSGWWNWRSFRMRTAGEGRNRREDSHRFLAGFLAFRLLANGVKVPKWA